MIATITVIAEKEYGNHFPAIAATKKKKIIFQLSLSQRLLRS